ncbi:MAG: hypothetical protein VW455_04100 [Nitrospinota bacterium]
MGPIFFSSVLFFFSIQPAASSDFRVTPPPKSMDQYYAEPGMPSDWIIQMQKLSTSLSSIFVNIEKKRWDLAEKNTELFLDQYNKASKMVPEWEEDFNLKAAREFQEDILNKDMKKIGESSETLEETCANCHLKKNTSVWVRYHWPSTETIKVLDPFEEKEIGYPQYMKMLSDSLMRITVNFEQKNVQDAWKSLEIFTKRLTSLRSVCSKCHVSEWTKSSVSVKDFFVGDDVMNALQTIKKEFATGEPSEKVFKANIEQINKQSCKMCHLVHQPTASIQRAWNQKN